MSDVVQAEELKALMSKYPDAAFERLDYAGIEYFCVLSHDELDGLDYPQPLGFGWTLGDAVAQAAQRIQEKLDERYTEASN